MATVDRLFPELQFLGQVRSTYVPVIPRALVLVTIKVKCRCGCEYEAPNAHMMLRFGKTLTSIGQWHSTYNSVPREEVVYNQKVPACKKCFAGGTWDFSDFLKHPPEDPVPD